MSKGMTRWERLRSAIRGQETDRPCVAFWRHFPVDDMNPESLALRSLEFQKKFEWDLVKFTPNGTYGVMDWGVETAWQNDPRGIRTVLKFGITSASEWQTLPLLNTTQGAYGQQNKALSLLARAIQGDAPILQTIFSPLTTARKLAGDRVFSDLRSDPELLKEGLETITAVTIRFALEAIQSGASGFFFATQNASYRWLSENEYREFGEGYDRRVLDAVKDKVEFMIVHIHGEDTMFDLLAKYPANILNWHDRLTPPSLNDARRRFSGLLAGGMNEWGALLDGPPEAIKAEAQDAVSQLSGRGIMLAPGCVVPIHVPEENLMLVRKAVESH